MEHGPVDAVLPTENCREGAIHYFYAHVVANCLPAIDVTTDDGGRETTPERAKSVANPRNVRAERKACRCNTHVLIVQAGRVSRMQRFHMPTWSGSAEFLDQFRNNAEEVADQAVVRDAEYRSLGVFVDSDDDVRVLHPSEVLNRT